MSEQISPEAREAAEKEHTWYQTRPIEQIGCYVQALLDSIRQQHAEEMAELRGESQVVVDTLKSQLRAKEDEIARLKEMEETWKRGAMEHTRVRGELERVTNVSKGMIADILANDALILYLRAENERLKGELERAWITQGDLREQSEVLKDKMEGLRSHLEAVTRQLNELKGRQ